MKIRCPGCGSDGEVSDDLAGKNVVCDCCGAVLVVPFRAEEIDRPDDKESGGARHGAEDKPAASQSQAFQVGKTSNKQSLTSKPEKIKFRCSCGRTYLLPEYFGGRKVRCSACGKRARVQKPGEPEEGAGLKREVVETLKECVCPHCWRKFAVEELLSIARHEALLGDTVLGPDEMQRFKPVHFTPEGYALDEKGFPCPDLACPHCHLHIPLALTEIKPTFLSIVGAPSSGKSYFLTAAAWELRRLMSRKFAFSFSDADTLSNQTLQQYEETLFLHPDPERFVRIEKTQLEGVLYDQITLEGQVIKLPRPFMFRLHPLEHNPMYAGKGEKLSRVLIVYDNAGEHFQPGTDTVANPVTQHLTRSSGIIFLFDPAQDLDFRRQCKSRDPQLKNNFRVSRQEVLLNEMTQRIRRYTALRQTEKYDHPLLIVVDKYDIWKDLLDIPTDAEPWRKDTQSDVWMLDVGVVEKVSASIREMLLKICPELVSTAEGFSSHVRYLPVSAMGCSPMEHPTEGGLVVRPKDIKPIWATVPFACLFAEWGLVRKA